MTSIEVKQAFIEFAGHRTGLNLDSETTTQLTVLVETWLGPMCFKALCGSISTHRDACILIDTLFKLHSTHTPEEALDLVIENGVEALGCGTIGELYTLLTPEKPVVTRQVH